jgi:hypothetical protein
MIWPEWKDDFMEVAERGKFTLNQDFEVYEGNEQVVVVSSLKGIEEYSISDLQKGQDLLFVYTDFNDGNDGYYKIKFTAKDSLNGIIEIIDMDGKVVNSQEAVMKETSTKTNGKDIKITIEKDPGGPCGITWLNNPKGRDLEINFTLIIKNN